jgi:flagellar biosynthetic protein FliR
MEFALLAGLPLLPLVRVLAVATAFPLLAGPGAPMHARLAVAAGLSFAVVPSAAIESAQLPLEATLLALPVEFMIGAAIGYAFSLVFHLLAIAGDFAGQEMGLNAASQIDPESGANVPLLARLFEAIGIVIFAETGGLEALCRTLRDSFDALPSGALLTPDLLASNLVAASLLAIRGGIALALPVGLSLFFITICTTIAARTLPRLHIFDFALAVRILIAIGLVTVLLPRLIPAIPAFSGTAAESVLRALPER